MDQPVPLGTTLLDLNDDCLREVFEHLDKEQLCDVADTCKRFRSLAQETFRASKLKTLNTHLCIQRENSADDRECVVQLRLLRNFGQEIESISFDDSKRTIWQRNRFFVYVGRHCGRELKSLELSCAGITDENVIELRHAIRNLEKLKLEDCKNEQTLLVNLPVWSPKLRELNFKSPNRKANVPGLRQAFPELKDVNFAQVRSDDLEVFLRLNEQLEGIEWDSCDDFIFRVVATHLPQIQRLEIEAVMALFPTNMVYLNQLRSLKVLNLTGHGSLRGKLPVFEPALDSLQKLTLCRFVLRETCTELTRLKNLKELRLTYARNITATHIIDVLTNCRQLSDLQLENCAGLKLSMNNFCDILRYGRALERFELIDWAWALDARDEERIIFDVDSYLRMVNIVQSRSNERISTEFGIWSSQYVNKIPEDLLAKHQHEVTVKMNEDLPRSHSRKTIFYFD